MRNLWLKIGLGAAGIFVVGMMGVTLAKNAKAAAVDAFHSAVGKVPAAVAAARAAAAEDRAAGGTAQLASLTTLEQTGGGVERFVDIPFRLEGTELGMLTSGSIRRTRSNALPSMELNVELSSADAATQLDDCILVPMRHRDSDFGGGFRCATSGDHDLVTFGRVRFTPGGFSRVLMLTDAQASDLRHGEPFEAKADLSGRVNVEATGDKGELVKVQADNHGAHIRINDENGRDIFQLLADSLGASLRVRDKNGRDIVRLAAGDGRLSLTIDTTGH